MLASVIIVSPHLLAPLSAIFLFPSASALWVEINFDGSILIPTQRSELFDERSEEKSERSEVDL